MSQEIALLYNLKGERAKKVQGVLMFLGIRVRHVEEADYGLKVGELAEGAAAETPWQGEGFAGEMMVLKVAPARVNMLVDRFRRHKVPLPMLTAVLTETNAQWDSAALAAELMREREAIMQGKTEH